MRRRGQLTRSGKKRTNKYSKKFIRGQKRWDDIHEEDDEDVWTDEEESGYEGTLGDYMDNKLIKLQRQENRRRKQVKEVKRPKTAYSLFTQDVRDKKYIPGQDVEEEEEEEEDDEDDSEEEQEDRKKKKRKRKSENDVDVSSSDPE